MKIIINGRELRLTEPMTILRAARLAHIEIPTLCHMEGANFEARCGLCLCRVKGRDELQKACETMAEEGMEIVTHSAEIFAARRRALEKLLAKHDSRCTTCFKSTHCKLQEYAQIYEAEPDADGQLAALAPKDESNAFYLYDPNKCILCLRCVNLCSALQCAGALREDENGLIAPAGGESRGACRCVSCGNCLDFCPTGALAPKNACYAEGRTPAVETVCPYCGVGCKINLFVRDNRAVGVTAANGPSNNGLLCVKGRFAFDFINHPDRLTTPLVRKDGRLVPCSWDEAYQAIINAFKKAREEGPEAIAGLSSARCSNEENYLFQKFIRVASGGNNVDHCARLCHSSTVAGLSQSFGGGAMSNSINEVYKTEVILVSGSNTTETHPVIGAKLRQAVKKGARLIVAEPRKIGLCEDAEIFLQIKPGTNVALFNGLIKAVLEEGLANKGFIAAHTEGFAEFEKGFEQVSVKECAQICRVSEDDLRQTARLYATAATAAIYYSMGVTQHSRGTDGVVSIANLALLCGQIGREGCGVNPLRGQNNVQGACDMGALPNLFPGYQSVAGPEARAKFEKAWGAALSPVPGKTSTEMIDLMEQGKIKFLYIMGENVLVSEADLNHARQAFSRGCFVAAQDIFLSETAALADVVLPAASFAEKEGTFTNTERRIQKAPQALPAPGEAKEDWRIICELARALGLSGFDFQDTSAVMEEISALTPSYGGVSYARLGTEGLQWPCPDAAHPGTPYLHKDGRFPRGKGLFSFRPYQPAADSQDGEYPLLLTTGRVLYQYHTRTMTGRNAAIESVAGTPFVEIHPQTAARFGIIEGEEARLTSPRGTVSALARFREDMAEDVLFMPFHFGENPVNNLTARHLDPTAKIPELKVSKVRISR
ncbi:MAG: formate dehydrogenase subunit alpha [Clostridiales bacterium]|nr:formate dehydrogenase subunit alpha [Clostridiales bacterium]